MFSGIVEELGWVEKIRKDVNLTTLCLRAKIVSKGIKIGDSVSVDGVCLTVTQKKGERLFFDVMKETLDKTILGKLKVKERVNLERALKVNDRISGHFVTGHIDGVGEIAKIIKGKNYVEMHVKAARGLIRYIVPKGSICINGVSLTVGIVGKNYFSFFLIPYTNELTNLGLKKEGQRVNVETDVLAKYVLNRHDI